MKALVYLQTVCQQMIELLEKLELQKEQLQYSFNKQILDVETESEQKQTALHQSLMEEMQSSLSKAVQEEKQKGPLAPKGLNHNTTNNGNRSSK